MRKQTWQKLQQNWDIIIIGGGITGAGILREAGRLGLNCLLVEQKDFAWGTSSRSSKLVHGGLRYLKEDKIGLTRESVHERQNLLEEGPGLIDPLGFLLASYKGDKVGRLVYSAGLTVYDLLKYYSAADFRMFAPHITAEGLMGGFRYGDAETDDARLVLRVIQEAVSDCQPGQSVLARNYTAVTQLQTDTQGQVTGVQVRDEVSGETAVLTANLVINATGAWADVLRRQVGGDVRIRPLRGSHLVFPGWRLKVAQAISFLHPIDQRPVMIFPWEGITLVGTTDVDHAQDLNAEPAISPDEVAYLMAAITSQFPALNITLDDVISTYAGVRPVIGTGKSDPSQESRDHVIWEENGLLTVTGGKLTTFRIIAHDVLEAARHRLPDLPPLDKDMPVLNPIDMTLPHADKLDEQTHQRLLGRYGADAPALINAAQPDELEAIPGTPYLWAELRWAARSEQVVHLDDLLLRRVRLGLLLQNGGAAQMSRIRTICQPELGWDDACWEEEEAAYLERCRRQYGLPPREEIPNWHVMLEHARMRAELARETAVAQQTTRLKIAFITLALAAVAFVVYLVWRRERMKDER